MAVVDLVSCHILPIKIKIKMLASLVRKRTKMESGELKVTTQVKPRHLKGSPLNLPLKTALMTASTSRWCRRTKKKLLVVVHLCGR